MNAAEVHNRTDTVRISGADSKILNPIRCSYSTDTVKISGTDAKTGNQVPVWAPPEGPL